MTTPRTASPLRLSPATVGPRLSLVTAVLAAAVLFGAGLLTGHAVAALAGWSGSAATGSAYGTAAALAALSAQASARRVLRARRRRTG
ncbi:MAG: hypothetical protein ACJ74O_12160 [Frankiaceae bacterium]